MTTTTSEKIVVMQAFVDGKPVEHRTHGQEQENWYASKTPIWDWFHHDYRVAKTKKWVNLYPAATSNQVHAGYLHNSKLEADNHNKNAPVERIACVEIEI